MPIVKAEVSNEAHKNWMDYCSAKDTKSAVLLRRYIEGITAGDIPAHSETVKDTKGRAIKIAFSKKDYAAISERVKREGASSRPSWIKKIVIAELDKAPIFNNQQLQVLDESCYELNAIGRNLNQIAHQLNIDFRDSNQITRELIEGLEKKIEKHTRLVYELINQSVRR